MAVKVVLTILRKLYQVFRRMIQNVELNIKCKSKNLKTIKKITVYIIAFVMWFSWTIYAISVLTFVVIASL